MAYRLLSVLEKANISEIVKDGLTKSTYNMLAQYLAPRGFGWAQATGVVRQVIPSFSGVDFAEQWYRPYQKVRQEKYAIDTAKTELIKQKNYIEHDLKEATRYMYEVEFDIFDDAGNKIDTQSRAYYSDSEKSPEDIEDEGARIFKDSYEKKGAQLGNFRFKGAYHNRMWDY